MVAEGKLVSVASEFGYITVDYTPVAASSTTSHRLCFEGQESAQDMVGINKVLSTQTGTLFNINVASYSLWRGNYVDCGNIKFSFDLLQAGVAAAVNRGGLEGDLLVLVNPRTWGKLITTENAKRQYDDSYKPSSAEAGQEGIVFYHQAGKATIMSHRFVKEGEAYALKVDDWSRSGSTQITFKVPGIGDKELIFPLENQAAMAFRSFSDEYIFCHAPARSILFYNINDESAS